MPIYDFACDNCKIEFDSLVKIGTLEDQCPTCFSICKRIVSRSNFHINGSSSKNNWNGNEVISYDGNHKYE